MLKTNEFVEKLRKLLKEQISHVNAARTSRICS